MTNTLLLHFKIHSHTHTKATITLKYLHLNLSVLNCKKDLRHGSNTTLQRPLGTAIYIKVTHTWLPNELLKNSYASFLLPCFSFNTQYLSPGANKSLAEPAEATAGPVWVSHAGSTTHGNPYPFHGNKGWPLTPMVCPPHPQAPSHPLSWFPSHLPGLSWTLTEF